MKKEQPPFHITNTMLTYVADISELIGRFQAMYNLESKPRLRRNNRIRSIYSSLKIEANSLSLSQVTDIINGRLVLGESREIQEVKNAYAAYERLPEIDPYSIKDLKKMHGVMTKYLVEESGVYRQGEEGVFNGETCIFMAPPARLVPELMEQLFSWMRQVKREQSVHPLILAAVFHYEFVYIHPFVDGNGRMARLWHTAILSEWQPMFAYIPLESQIEKFQDGYYKAIAACHTQGNSDLFIEFILDQIDRILETLSGQVPGDGEQITEYVKRLLSVMEPDISYTAAEIMERLDLKSKETLRKNYLHPAMEMQLVEMTIPEKPTSRNQRYRRRNA